MEHTENKTIIHDTEKTASWEQQTAMKVSGISILVNLLLSVFKLIAGIVAHSGAMISDAIHSASDVGSTFIVIIGVRLSTKKSDKEHQYGHERMECVSSIVLATKKIHFPQKNDKSLTVTFWYCQILLHLYLTFSE